MTTRVVEAAGLAFAYEPPRDVFAVDGFVVEAGMSVAILGPSGSGKSTLLSCLAGLLNPDRGEVMLGGRLLAQLDAESLLAHRRSTVGFVFQEHLLLDDLPIVENVALPLMLDGVSRGAAIGRAGPQLDRLGIGDLRVRLPEQVSRGQRQRAAVARALVGEPAIIFADEPTGSLDAASGAAVADGLFAAIASRDAALVLVTHAEGLAARCDRIVQLEGGRLQEVVGR